jgi:hypothetical protein
MVLQPFVSRISLNKRIFKSLSSTIIIVLDIEIFLMRALENDVLEDEKTPARFRAGVF